MGLLTADEYPAIRGVIDVTLDEDALPDSVIEQVQYGPAAELWVLTYDPDAASRTGDDQARITTALVCYCASLIAPSIPNLTGETQGPYSYSRAAVDWTAHAAVLRSRAVAAIQGITAVTARRMPVLFTRAPGGRGY